MEEEGDRKSDASSVAIRGAADGNWDSFSTGVYLGEGFLPLVGNQ